MRVLFSSFGLIALMVPGKVWGRIGRDDDLHRLADGDFRYRLLGHEEVDVEAAEVLQGGDHGAAGQVVANVHLANADGAAEGRDDAFFAERSLELIDRGLALFQDRREPIELAFGNGLAAHQLAAATVIELGQPEVGLGGFEQGAFHGAVQSQQRLTGLDLLPGLELQVDDRAVGLQAQVDALQRLERADRGQAGLPWPFGGRGHGDADRRFGRGEALDHRVDGEGFVTGQDQHDQQNNTQHDQHAATQHISSSLEKIR